MDGILLVDKPAGLTSYDVVARAKRALGQKKLGHSGTLDPQATGLLVLALGAATRWLPYLPSDKKYQATLKMGLRTDTQDIWGKTIEEKPAKDLDPRAVRQALEGLKGERDQVPPAVSALKHEGKPLYEWARQGKEIIKPPRRITVFSLRVTRVEGDEADFEVHCSGGTYVRTLCAEVGEILGTGGCLKALRRVAAGNFGIGQALSLETLEKAQGLKLLGHLEALGHLPVVKVAPEEMDSVNNGMDLRRGSDGVEIPARGCRLVSASGELLALGTIKPSEDGLVIHPDKVFKRA